MEFKDYYARLGIEKSASPEDIKRAYRKLARKFHPDVSKEPEAEAQFKEVAEAYEALKDPERRAAYDAVGSQRGSEKEFRPPPDWNNGFEFTGGGASASDHSDFFEALFGQGAAGMRGRHASPQAAGEDHHAKVQIDLIEAFRGGHRTIALQKRQLDVNIPRGVRNGQHLRLKGQGGPAHGAGPAGDLYLEISIAPHKLFRLDGRDIYIDLPIAPWEAALGASVTVPTPDGSVQLTIPAQSSSGRHLRLRGKGLPGSTPGDLYVVLSVTLPPADSDDARAAYDTFRNSFEGFDPRAALAEVTP